PPDSTGRFLSQPVVIIRNIGEHQTSRRHCRKQSIEVKIVFRQRRRVNGARRQRQIILKRVNKKLVASQMPLKRKHKAMTARAQTLIEIRANKTNNLRSEERRVGKEEQTRM